MEPNRDIIQQLLMQLLSQGAGGSSPAQPDSWRNTPGFNSGPSTALSQFQSQISKFSQDNFGPLGSIAAGLFNKYVLGPQFNRYGGMNQKLSGVVMPGYNQTYSGAFANMLQSSQLASVQGQSMHLQSQLGGVFARRYIQATSQADIKKVQDKAWNEIRGEQGYSQRILGEDLGGQRDQLYKQKASAKQLRMNYQVNIAQQTKKIKAMKESDQKYSSQVENLNNLKKELKEIVQPAQFRANEALASFDKKHKYAQKYSKLQTKTKEKAKQDYIKGRLTSDEDRPSLSNVLDFFFDPTDRAKAQKNFDIIGTRAASHAFGRDPLNTEGLDSAKRLQQATRDMFMQANGYNYKNGQLTTREKRDYGGFSGAQVTQLAQFMAGFQNPQDLSKDTQAFKRKIRQMTTALGPLKDVFGQDMKKLISAVQDLSGQNIASLGNNPAIMKNLATKLVDTMHLTGATPDQIYRQGNVIKEAMRTNGASDLAQLGASSVGMSSLATLMGNYKNMGYMSNQAFNAGVTNAYASAQASTGVNYLALSYSLWKRNQGSRKVTVRDFNDKIRDLTSSGYSLDQAMVKVAGVRDRASLTKGYGYQGYSQGLASGQLAGLAVSEGQFKQTLAMSFGSAMVRAGQLGLSTGAVNSAFNKMKNNSKLAARVFAGGVDKLQSFVNSGEISAQESRALAVVMQTKGGNKLRQLGAVRQSQIQLRDTRRNWDNFRSFFQQANDKPGGLYQGLFTTWGNTQLQNSRKKILQVASAKLFGTGKGAATVKGLITTTDNKGNSIAKLSKAQAGQVVQSALMGKLAQNKQAIQDLKKIAAKDTKPEQRQKLVHRTRLRLAGITQKQIKQTEKGASAQDLKQLNTSLQNISNSNITQEQRNRLKKTAVQRFRNKSAARKLEDTVTSGYSYTRQQKQIRSKVIAQVKKGTQLDKAIEEQTKGKQNSATIASRIRKQFQQKKSSNAGQQLALPDVMNKLNTLLQKLITWLTTQNSSGEKGSKK